MQNQDFGMDIQDQIDQYIEWLYEDSTQSKIKAAKNILYLTISSPNLQYFAQHDSLMAVVARTLRDQYKRSLTLTLYLLYIFYAYSNYSSFHQFIGQKQIGDSTMKIIEYEIKRYNAKIKEFRKRKEEAMTLGKEDGGKLLQQERAKIYNILKKQEKVLFVAFYLLLNLSESQKIERKMKKLQIIPNLVMMLDRYNPDLLIAVLTFLFKMSIIAENKDQMIQLGVIQKLFKFLSCDNQIHLMTSIRILFNLSFDQDARLLMDKCGMTSKFVGFLEVPGLRKVILGLLYHLSLEDSIKANFKFTDCIPLVYQLIIHFPQPFVGKQLVALAINLTMNPGNASQMAQGDQFDQLIQRAMTKRDTLLFKVIRNIAQNDQSSAVILSNYIYAFYEMIETTPNSDLQLQLIGTLVHADTDQWQEFMQKTAVLNFLNRALVVDAVEDDVLLECIMLCATICFNDKCSQKIAGTYIIKLLDHLIQEKHEDDEIVHQTLFTFYKLLIFRDTREIIMYKTQIINIVLELLNHKLSKIREISNNIIDVVMEEDEDWSEQIKQRRYQIHNQIYRQIIQKESQVQMMQNGEMMDEDIQQQQQIYYPYEYENAGEDEDDMQFDSDDGIQWYDGTNNVTKPIWDEGIRKMNQQGDDDDDDDDEEVFLN